MACCKAAYGLLMRCKPSALSSALRDFNGDAIRGYTLEAKSFTIFFTLKLLFAASAEYVPHSSRHFDSLYAAITPIVVQAMFMITR